MSAISGNTRWYCRVETPPQQDIQHPGPQTLALLHGFVGREGNFFPRSPAWPPEPWPVHGQLSLLQAHPSPLAPIPAHPTAPPALTAWTGHLRGRQLQHHFNRRPTHHVDQLVDG